MRIELVDGCEMDCSVLGSDKKRYCGPKNCYEPIQTTNCNSYYDQFEFFSVSLSLVAKMCGTDFVSFSQKWRIRGSWSTLARVLSAGAVGKRNKLTSLMHGTMFRGVGLVSRVIVGHLCTNLHIFGMYRLCSILGSFYIFEASRGSGEGGSVDLGGGAHFYYMHGWVG